MCENPKGEHVRERNVVARETSYAHEGIPVRIAGEREEGEQVAHLVSREEVTEIEHRDPSHLQERRDASQDRMRSAQDRLLAVAQPCAPVVRDGSGDVGDLRLEVLVYRKGGPPALIRADGHPRDEWCSGAGTHPRRQAGEHVDDAGLRSIIARESPAGSSWEVSCKPAQVLRCGSAEAVDRLPHVADDPQPGTCARELTQETGTGSVHVLILIDQDLRVHLLNLLPD